MSVFVSESSDSDDFLQKIIYLKSGMTLLLKYDECFSLTVTCGSSIELLIYE